MFCMFIHAYPKFILPSRPLRFLMVYRVQCALKLGSNLTFSPHRSLSTFWTVVVYCHFLSHQKMTEINSQWKEEFLLCECSSRSLNILIWLKHLPQSLNRLFLCRVFHSVASQVRLLSEGFVTNIALISFLPRVCPHMNFQVCIQRETFATFFAPAWFLPCVSYHMGGQISLQTKAFATFRAGIWFLPCMGPRMFCQFFLPTEAFPAIIALIGFLSCVNFLVAT